MLVIYVYWNLARTKCASAGHSKQCTGRHASTLIGVPAGEMNENRRASLCCSGCCTLCEHLRECWSKGDEPRTGDIVEEQREGAGVTYSSLVDWVLR